MSLASIVAASRNPLRAAVAGVAGELREQVRYRELLYQMTVRDLRLRYKQTAMGVGWAIVLPLAQTLIFTMIFTRVARIETAVPYPLYAFCGLLPWTFFASSLRFAATSLTSNSALVTKVYFPREVFPVSVVLVALVDFMVASTVLLGLMLYYGVPVASTAWMVPILVAIQMTFTIGLALLLAMANLFYRDVKYLLDVVLTVWMFATSVVFPIDRIGGRLGDLLALNPMTPIIDGYRDVILFGQLPSAPALAGIAMLAVVTLAGGWLIFHRAESRFAESL